MRFKVASRARGLSDEAFREGFGTEEQCRAALLRLRWPDGFLCPCCGHRGHCVLAGRGALSMQPVQEADIAHGGHESTRTTQLYNRMHEELSLDEIERIHI